jgi:AmmeMemoRadiSam system protein A
MNPDMLTAEEKSFLLSMARRVIEDRAYGRTPDSGDYFSEALTQKVGVFVTIYKDSDLRGCIGYVEGIHPLQRAVSEMASAAAFEDPRFPSITPDELTHIQIEISVLSPIIAVKSIEEIKIGKHGLIVEKGLHKGVLLPQVAIENNWDRQKFLEFTCVKAGLSADEWQKKDTKLERFSAEIFSE